MLVAYQCIDSIRILVFIVSIIAIVIDLYSELRFDYCRYNRCCKDAAAQKMWELAAMGGDMTARHNLGGFEIEAGNIKRAVIHYMIATAAGYDKSLGAVRQSFLDGYATKDDFERALRAHKEANDETKSEQRDAAATDQEFRRSFNIG